MQIFCARVSLRLPIENSMGRAFPHREREREALIYDGRKSKGEKSRSFLYYFFFCGEARVLWRWRWGAWSAHCSEITRLHLSLSLSKVPRISIYSTKGAQGATIPILTHHVHHHPPKGIRPDQQRWNLASDDLPRFSVWFAAGFTSLKENKWTVKECSLFFFDIDWKKEDNLMTFPPFILFFFYCCVESSSFLVRLNTLWSHHWAGSNRLESYTQQ